MTCRTCKHLAVDRTKETVRKGKCYACAFIFPPLPLPDSITRYHGFTWPLHRTWMVPDDGESCPCYKPFWMNTEIA